MIRHRSLPSVAFFILILAMPVLALLARSDVPTAAEDMSICNGYRQVDDAREFGLSENEGLIFYDNGRIYIYEIPTGLVRKLPFAETSRAWSPSNSVLPSDSFRIPPISPNGRMISYGSAYSSENLSQSVHFIWSLLEGKMVSSFVWQPNWIHFIGWLDDEHLVFQTRNNTFDVVDLKGDPVGDPIVIEGLQLNVPYDPWALGNQGSSFYLWSTMSAAGNVFQIFRSGSDRNDTKVVAYSLAEQSIFYEKGVGDWWWLRGNERIQNPRSLTPAWSHSGAVLAVPMWDRSDHVNLHLLSSAGEIEQITALDYSQVGGPVWSGDDSLILFWVSEQPPDRPWAYPDILHAFELESGRIISLGRPGGADSGLIVSRPLGRVFSYIDVFDYHLVFLDLDACTFLEQPFEESMLDWFMLDWYVISVP
jgi:hypothetical protein